MRYFAVKEKSFIVCGVLLLLVVLGVVFVFSRDRVQRISEKLSQPASEPELETFKLIEPIEIDGYRETAMEPFQTGNGKYLLFNDSNAPDSNSKIHICKRLDSAKFKYLGKLPGAISGSKDMAPSIDDNGNFYFTSLREYPKTLKSLFHGKFLNEEVSSVSAIEGNISSQTPGWLNMDCEVSKDGSLFCYSRARFEPGGHIPVESDLFLARVVDGKILKEPQSEKLMKNINTKALEYAPAFVKNGLELYFNRADMLMVGNIVNYADVRILKSSRTSLEEPFGSPVKLKNVNGLVEGATLSDDGRELIFHKKAGGRYKLFRAFN